eukprot:Protomagalhaensia_wolfi_Nauph_80__5983@NODE_808_length_1983_cov_9_031379_g605_i0_p2_GENE_NODE_808_length_1983_cov_9_031379_g605_i0NODE_808_length_1983_cov_9_031379_g605_i0_p2_ORF_typecomplete_len230_score32_87_NODE_808_length_1983_cov_9_031379_g605_i090779
MYWSEKLNRAFLKVEDEQLIQRLRQLFDKPAEPCDQVSLDLDGDPEWLVEVDQLLSQVGRPPSNICENERTPVHSPKKQILRARAVHYLTEDNSSSSLKPLKQCPSSSSTKPPTPKKKPAKASTPKKASTPSKYFSALWKTPWCPSNATMRPRSRSLDVHTKQKKPIQPRPKGSFLKTVATQTEPDLIHSKTRSTWINCGTSAFICNTRRAGALFGTLFLPCTSWRRTN